MPIMKKILPWITPEESMQKVGIGVEKQAVL